MTVPYATLDDVFLLGLSAQAFVSRARPVATADVNLATGVIRLEAHGLDDADVITVRVTSGGTLATGLVTTASYGVEVVSFDLLRITSGGVSITSYASAGSGWTIAIDPRRRLNRHILDASAMIDDLLTGHEPPLERDDAGDYPEVVVGLCARLAAWTAVTSLQFENAVSREAVDRLEAQIEDDRKRLATYLAGRPILPRPTDQNAIPDNAATAQSGVAVNWQLGYM